MVNVRLKLPLFLCGLLALSTSRSVLAADIDQGKLLYERFCSRCHGVDGYRVLPQAADLARGEGLLRSNRQLRERLEAGKGVCPSYRGLMKDRDFTNLIMYIRTLR